MTTENTPPNPPDELDLESQQEAPAEMSETDRRLAELQAREDALAEREKLAAIAVAEANLALRTIDVERMEASVAAGRSGSARTGDIRSEDITQPARRQRRYKSGEMPNEFHIPAEEIPAGVSYQWNNYSILGQENPSYNAHMQMQGWEPVDSTRHPHLMPPGHTGPIIVKGQILVERPMELTLEALAEDEARAHGEVRAKEDQLYGQRPDTPVGKSLGIKKEFERPTAELPRNYQYEQAGGPVIE